MCAGIRVSESKRDIFSGRYVCQIGRKTRTKRNRPISFGVGLRLGSVLEVTLGPFREVRAMRHVRAIKKQKQVSEI